MTDTSKSRAYHDHGYTICTKWIGPVEGTSYRVSLMGQEPILAWRKSERAAYNAIVRLVIAEALGREGQV